MWRAWPTTLPNKTSTDGVSGAVWGGGATGDKIRRQIPMVDGGRPQDVVCQFGDVDHCPRARRFAWLPYCGFGTKVLQSNGEQGLFGW